MSKENTVLVGDWLVKLDGLSIQSKHQNKDLDLKVMQLLVYLVNNRDRVVTRNELLDQLWKDQVVADDVLNVAMSSLRKALGDDFKTPIYIKTLPRKGYQLIAPVKARSQENRRIKLNWMIAVLLVLVVATPIWIKLNPLDNPSNSSASLNPEQSIRLAVLPFDYYSSATSREYIADGLTEAIINRLVQESDLQVTSRTSVMQYKHKKIAIKEVVEQLNVEWVLEGSVQLEGDKIQVTAQLIDAVKDSHIWSETFQRNVSDLFDIQTEVAAEIVSRLNLSSEASASDNANVDSVTKPNQIPAEAYDRFLQAQFFQYKGEHEKAVNAYQRAIEHYPDYAEAYAHLSHSYFSKSYSAGERAGELIDKASELAKKALQIDPTPAYVQLVTALTYLYKDYNYQAAGQAFQLAFERNNQDLMILEWYTEFLLITEQFDKVEQLATHMVTVSPLAYNKITNYRALYFSGDFKGAEREIAIKSPTISVRYRESLYVWNALASDNQESLLTHMPQFLKELELPQSTIDDFIGLLKDQGRSGALKFIAEKIPALSNYDQARLYAWAGENEKAILILQSLVADRNLDVLRLAIEPAFKSLGNESTYIALLKELELN